MHYDFNNFIYIKRSDGNNSKRYFHWCTLCQKERGFAYKNKILKEPLCHSCKMQQTDVKEKISQQSKKLKHSTESKNQISNSLYMRYGSNPTNRKIARNLRSRLNKAISGNFKSGSAVKELGCSIEEFKLHIESLWIDGMNWDNYGKNGWQIDHIKPLCKINLSDPQEFKAACHYSNLQPLWFKDNLEKRKIDGTF